MNKEIRKLIQEKLKLYESESLYKVVRKIQNETFKKAINLYTDKLNILQDKSFTEKGTKAAVIVNRFEKKISDAISKNRAYNTEIRKYYTKFGTMDKLNLKIHKMLNGEDISKVIKMANKQQRGLVGNVAEGIVSKERIKVNLAGAEMRKEFSRPVKKMLYQNVIKGTPPSVLREELHDYIIGNKSRVGQLERWSGQITRDTISQYDGAVNDMVREEYDMKKISYIGSLVKDSRPQCQRWVRMKEIPYEKLKKEISWAKYNGQGMIPGTNKDNFCTYRGGYNCRHEAIPTNK